MVVVMNMVVVMMHVSYVVVMVHNSVREVLD